MMNCRKCDSSGTILIRKEYWYCDTCFLTNTYHKFRACLGKSKLLSPNERVLICLSGDSNSTVLLDFIHSSTNLSGTKKLRIIPFFIHIMENVSSDASKKANLLIEQCKKYDFYLYVAHIDDYYSSLKILSEPNIIPQANTETLEQMKVNVSTTICHDFIIKIKRNLFLRAADELNCKIIFTAESTTQLAKRLLTNLALGRGSQVENDIGFVDQRDESIKILRPMKDISSEEIDCFINVQKLDPIYDNSNTEIGLQSVIDKFVVDLQENFSSTISTVCKTADKLGSMENNKNNKKCSLCQSNISFKATNLTAVEATIFSRQMCFKQADANDKIEDLQNMCEDKNPMFPSLYETLCYGCSRNFSELKNCKSSFILSNVKNKEL